MSRISNIEYVSKQVSSQIEFCFQSRVKGLEQRAEQNAQYSSLIDKRTEHMEGVLEQLLNRHNPCTELMLVLREVKNMVECESSWYGFERGGANNIREKTG